MAKTDTPRVLLDSSALIATIAGEPAAARIDGLLGMLDRGEAQLVESVIVLGEVYRRSESIDDTERRSYDARLSTVRTRLESREVTLLDVTIPVAKKATEFRQQYHLKLPDAIHLATAILNRCDWLVTLDRDFPQKLEELHVIRLEQSQDPLVRLPWDRVVQEALFTGSGPSIVIPLR